MFMAHHSPADYIPTITEKYLLKDLWPAPSFQEQVGDSDLVHLPPSPLFCPRLPPTEHLLCDNSEIE